MTESENSENNDMPNFFMFPNFLEVQDVPVQSDSSGLDDSEFHNFVGKFVILPEDEEANLLETSLDLSHRLEDPHFRSKVSYAADGTRIIQHESKENTSSYSKEQQTDVDSESRNSSKEQDSDNTVAGQTSGMSPSQGNITKQEKSGDFDVYKQDLQVSYADDGTKIIQHAPTALPPNKYNVTTPVPGPKPTQSIHYGIKYPKPNTTLTKYYRKDGTRITQFNTGIKSDNGTMDASWAFIPDEYVPGFSDDDEQPNAAGYKYRNRAGEKEKGNLIKEQIDEAVNENNPTYQFKSEGDIVNELNKPSHNKTDTNQLGSGNQNLLKSSSIKDTAKKYQPERVLYEVRPLKPHHYIGHRAESEQKRGFNTRHHKEMLTVSVVNQNKKIRRKHKIKKVKLLKSRKKSTAGLEMMPLPVVENRTEVIGEEGFMIIVNPNCLISE